MKDPVQAKENANQTAENESKESSLGVAKTPPSFSLAASPIQKKEDPQKADKKPLSKQGQFVAKYAASAAALEAKDGIPALFTLGQGALESGWGEKAIGNALFGIKAGASWEGKKQLVTTTEYFKDDKQGHRFPEVISITKVEDGKYKYKVKDWFRDYETVEAGLADHSRFLITNKRYAGAFNTTTPEAFAQAVAAAGYATASNYGDTLVSMIASVKKHWPADAGAIPTGNSKSITGGKPGGSTPDPKNPKPETTTETKTPTTGGGTPTTGNSISGSVGEGGANKPADALLVKQLLIKAGYGLSNTPDVGPKTIGFIKDYQSKVLGWKNPDGLVEPGGNTFQALLKGGGVKPETTKPVTKPATPAPAGANFDGLAQRLYDAMFNTGYGSGLGTNEAEVYAVLSSLGRDATKIQSLKAAYQKKYGHDLTTDLRAELSDSVMFGNELSKALEMLSPKAATQPKGETKPATTPVKDAPTKDAPGKVGNQTAGSTGSKLDQFYNDFSKIKVKSGDKVIEVTPPYHINRGDRMDNAAAARKANPKVAALIADLVSQGKVNSLAKIGKAQPADLKAILEEAVSQGLVKHDASAMHEFLSKYGLSTDCSGYVSQALNFLMDGNQTIDKKDGLQPGNYGSGSLKGGTTDFTKIEIANVKAGDTMHVEGHIRIINEVVVEDKIVYFRTAESTGATNKETGNDGLMTRWWKSQDGKKYYTWKSQSGPHPASDDKSWVQSKEANTFGRYKKLEK
ncbi:MAG: glucosaminidase domain-containing protein [Bacteroidetes bacterium]|nr:glucosaminidase domain-containing protein [Bacteroidota bacterium]